MIVIQDNVTLEKFKYPSTNSNIELYEDFLQVQDVPVGYTVLAEDPYASDYPHFHHVREETRVIRYEP